MMCLCLQLCCILFDSRRWRQVLRSSHVTESNPGLPFVPLRVVPMHCDHVFVIMLLLLCLCIVEFLVPDLVPALPRTPSVLMCSFFCSARPNGFHFVKLANEDIRLQDERANW